MVTPIKYEPINYNIIYITLYIINIILFVFVQQ